MLRVNAPQLSWDHLVTHVPDSSVCHGQVIYPLTIEAAAARESATDSSARMQALDSRLDGLMMVVRLQYLVAREGGWGAQAEWGETLSLGAPPPSPSPSTVAY